MTRLDRLLLRIPRLRDIVRDREAFAAHTARLRRELDESLARERALCDQLAEAAREATMHSAARSVAERMRHDWDVRASAAGRYFIATGAEDWPAFYASGKENVRQHISTDLENICRGMDPKQMRIVEIGCGAGRLTRALAAIFGEVHAVDVSPEMVRLAREHLGPLANVHLYVNNGADLSALPAESFHFAYSFIVFQHIPDKDVIESYLREVHRVLEPGALFKFQVDGGRSEGSAAEDTWHGVSFAEDEIRALAERTGFDLRFHEGAGTQYFWLWLFKR
jgi:SAM-dependent methyltransferase